jgi:hypothetical protein
VRFSDLGAISRNALSGWMDGPSPSYTWEPGLDPRWFLYGRMAAIIAVCFGGPSLLLPVVTTALGAPLLGFAAYVAIGVPLILLMMIFWPATATIGVGADGVLVGLPAGFKATAEVRMLGFPWNAVHRSGGRFTLKLPRRRGSLHLILTRRQQALLASWAGREPRA